MNDNNLDNFKEVLQETIDEELDSMETFSKDMVEHIQNVYADLLKQRQEWLENKKEEQS